MKQRTLTDLREEMRAVARGERDPSPRPVASLLKALSPEALELLELLLQEHPATVAEVAERTGRAQPNISRSLQLLARLGLVEMHREGREVRPVPTTAKLVIDFATGTYDSRPLEPAV